MTWSRQSYLRGPYSAGDGIEDLAPGLQQIPPSIPGGSTRFLYQANIGTPWSYRSWSGGGLSPRYPGGGIIIAPDEAQGVMRVLAWWPDADVLQLVRVTPDGVRTPVRGAYPWVVDGVTRRNNCCNPGSEGEDSFGYIPGEGNPTLAQFADADAPGGLYVERITATEDGPCGVKLPATHASGWDSVEWPWGPTVTIGLELRLSTPPSSVEFTVDWLDADNLALGTTTVALDADAINASVHTFSRQVVRLTGPDGAVGGSFQVIVADLLIDDTYDLDDITIEFADTDGSAFNGDTLGGQWIPPQPVGLGASIVAPVQTILDGECPLDIPVRYMVVNPALLGGSVTSTEATLSSRGWTWLTHPTLSDAPLRVELTVPPVLEHAIEQGVFLPIGRARPIVVSAAMRQAPTGTVDMIALSFTQRDQLRDLFADAAPVLLRAPGEFGFGPGMWLALGAITEDRENRKPWQEAVLLSAEFVEVDAPAVT